MTRTLVGTPDPEPRPYQTVILGVNTVETSNSSFTGKAVLVSPVSDNLSSYTFLGWRWDGQ